MKISANTIKEALEILNKRFKNMDAEWEYDDNIDYFVCIEEDNEGITENHYSYFFDENELCFTLKHEF